MQGGRSLLLGCSASSWYCCRRPPPTAHGLSPMWRLWTHYSLDPLALAQRSAPAFGIDPLKMSTHVAKTGASKVPQARAAKRAASGQTKGAGRRGAQGRSGRWSGGSEL